MKILTTPWKNDFLDLVAGSEQSIKITSPFVKANICRELVSVKKQTIEVELLTSFKLPSIYSGSLDLSALELIISNNGRIKNFPKLHSKIYLFDEKQAVITSGNLTNGGLLRNYEYGILTDEPNTIKEICSDFKNLWNGENTGSVRQTDIDSVKDILNQLPKIETIKFPTFSIDADSPEQNFEVLEISNDAVRNTLSGWKLEVFNCLDKINNQNFTLNDIYSYEKHLEKIYPTNRNIKDKIRQQLQYLRDLGLVEFLGAGNYRKLWK
jgi:hypothetical protein